MKGPTKVGAFVLALAGLVATGFAVGRVTDTADPTTASERTVTTAPAAVTETPPNVAGLALPGLAVADRGYALRLLDPTVDAGAGVPVRFEIVGPDGTPVREYRRTHERDMHLIVVRRDLSRFQHLHPDLGAGGAWQASVALDSGGVYRVFADFAPAALNEPITLGTDLFVAGDFRPEELPEPAATWSDQDYSVALSGNPSAGTHSELSFTVTRAGAPVGDLEPYLGAFGHLVSLRPGDLAYLHTHPSQDAAADARGGPEIRFATTFPTAGRYRLYLNFAHAGTVRTAEFTVDVPASANPAPQQPAEPTAPESPMGEHSGH
jgi:hypothetical protein